MEKRTLQAVYIDTTPSTTATYALLGKGVDDSTVDYGPKTETFQDIISDTATTNLIGYEPKISHSMKFDKADPAFVYLNGLRRARAILSAADTSIILVDLWATAVAGAYPAEKQSVNISFSKYGGAGGESLVVDYDINFKGDAVLGTFNPTTKTFTAA